MKSWDHLPRLSKPYRKPNGQWATRQLFFDQWTLLMPEDQRHQPIFDLHRNDRPGLISCRHTFLELNDPTGYKWAMEYLGDWNHWLQLMKSPFFREAYELWIAEMKTRDLATALSVIKEATLAPDAKTSFAAAKYLAERPWEKPKAGRPSKTTIDAELKRAIRERTQEEDDADRIGLTLVSN